MRFGNGYGYNGLNVYDVMDTIAKSLGNDLNQSVITTDVTKKLKSKIQSFVKMNIVSTDEGCTVSFLVPGFSKDELKLEVSNNVLKLSGKKETKEDRLIYKEFSLLREFNTEFDLSEKLDLDSCQSSLKNGILTVTFSYKKSKDPNSKQIQIAE